MSWSEGRDSDNKIDPEKFKTERAEALKLLNGNLKFLAENSDFHEDLKLPVVQAAFMHWTGKNRLPPEQANRLMSNQVVRNVFGTMQKLQNVCKDVCRMPVPLDHVLARESELGPLLVAKFFGEDLVDREKMEKIMATIQANKQTKAKKTKSEPKVKSKPADNTVTANSSFQESSSNNSDETDNKSKLSAPTVPDEPFNLMKESINFARYFVFILPLVMAIMYAIGLTPEYYDDKMKPSTANEQKDSVQ